MALHQGTPRAHSVTLDLNSMVAYSIFSKRQSLGSSHGPTVTLQLLELRETQRIIYIINIILA
eukprot:1340110-Amorphochlora_amoeboformis.AAC.1